MDNCKIVEDLLPVYCDGLASEETAGFVRSHTQGCPRCARLLEQMTLPVKKNSEVEKAVFRETLKIFALQHRVRVLSIVLVCVSVLILLFAVSRGSLDIGLSIRGLDVLHTVEQTVSNTSGRDTKLLLAKDKEENLVLVRADKNAVGFWTTLIIDTSEGKSSPTVSTSWYNGLGMHYYKPEKNTYSIGWNFVYCGDNARKVVEFAEGQIPENVTVRIDQYRTLYIVHVISYAEPEVTNNFHVFDILRQNGCIS